MAGRAFEGCEVLRADAFSGYIQNYGRDALRQATGLPVQEWEPRVPWNVMEGLHVSWRGSISAATTRHQQRRPSQDLQPCCPRALPRYLPSTVSRCWCATVPRCNSAVTRPRTLSKQAAFCRGSLCRGKLHPQKLVKPY